MTTRRSAAAFALAAVVAAGFAQPRSAVDAAFASFFDARTPGDAASSIDRIVASGVGFDEAIERLARGRPYARDVARGLVEGSRREGGVEFFYTLDVPESYDPGRRYPVQIQLHGGVDRMETSARRSGSIARLQGGGGIRVMPYAWRDAPWWSTRQIDNLRAILDLVKRTYNVDENRVALSGVSDGGTAAYYIAMRETTTIASVLPLNGFIKVLDNEIRDGDGDLFPGNLVNKPLFVVNGGRDPLYPASAVEPYVEQLQRGGVDLIYRPQANAGHDTAWWPEVREPFERFVADHPRVPLPDTFSWESGPPNVPSRAHWLVVDRLRAARDGEPVFADVNAMAGRAEPDFGIRGSGARIHRVLDGSNAAEMGLRPGDIVSAINNQPVPEGADIADLLRSFPPGRPLVVAVVRGDASVRLTGRYTPSVLERTRTIFTRQRESGRVDLARTGNRVDARCRGVASFTLLLSPSQFDLDRAVTVVVNGRTAFEGIVHRDIRTLLGWAARDNDRTMLFAAALPIAVP